MRCFEIKDIAGKALSAFAPMVLLGCSTIPLGASTALAQTAEEQQIPSQSQMDSQLMFELMVAELASRRGQLDVALAGYLSASERTTDPRVSERAARLSLFGRQWEQAEKAARRWISLDPENTEAPQLLGHTLIRQNKADATFELFNPLLQNSDDRRQLLRSIQFELQSNENPATSIAVMRQIANEYKEDAEAQLGLARAHITNSDTPSALAAVEAALMAAPDDTDSLLLRAQILGSSDRQDEAFSSLSKALQDSPQNTDLRLGYAQLLVDRERYAEVLAELEIIHSQLSGQSPEKLLTISLLAIESNHLDQATTYLTELKDSAAYSDRASFYLGRISDDKKAYPEAIAHYDEVGQGDVYFNSQVRAAELTALTGDVEGSRSRLQRLAAQVRDPLLQPRLVAAESRILQSVKQHAEAVLVLSEGLERFPDNADLLYARALAAQNDGDAKTMIADLKRLIELDADNAYALNALGYYYADENIELDQAEELLVKANALLPDDPAIMDSLGWLRYRQGNFAQAITLLRAAYELYPDPEIAAHLGEALWLNGAEQEARELIEMALQDNPEDERLMAVMEKTFK